MVPTYPYFDREIKCQETPVTFPPQHQDVQPGLEYLMNPVPISDNKDYKGSGKLKGKTAVITGGDSGIGRAIAIGFAKEGADIVIAYTPRERQDADLTRRAVEFYGQRLFSVEGDLELIRK
jgi:hypothetical protein